MHSERTGETKKMTLNVYMYNVYKTVHYVIHIIPRSREIDELSRSRMTYMKFIQISKESIDFLQAFELNMHFESLCRRISY